MSGHPAGGHDLGAEWEPAEGIVRGPGGGAAGSWQVGGSWRPEHQDAQWMVPVPRESLET